MKVYLASRYSLKPVMTEYASELRCQGICVTSTWLEEPHPTTTKLSDLKDGDHTTYALNDLRDVDRADVLVFFSVEPTTPMVRGGRHVEFGYALFDAIRGSKQIVVVGPKENIFHYIPQVTHVESWKEAVALLVQRKESTCNV